MPKDDKRFIKTYKQSGASLTEIWVDKETGVNYFFHSAGYSGGLCPLYDKDGRVVVTPIKE